MHLRLGACQRDYPTHHIATSIDRIASVDPIPEEILELRRSMESVPSSTSMSILIICTGNLCRSPLAARLLGQRLTQSSVDATVQSAGFIANGSNPPPPLVQVALEMGVDLARHHSRQVLTSDLDRATLILCASRKHVRETVTRSPETWPKSFTLKEFVRRARTVENLSQKQTAPEWIGRIHVGRRREDLLGSSAMDDIEDPMGRSAEAYRNMAREIAMLVDCLALILNSARATPIEL